MLSDSKNNKVGDTGRKKWPSRIILTGYRGTGKSLVGAGLAKQLGCDFIDTDYLLSEQFQCSLANFVRKEGWDAFRQAEKNLLAKLAHANNVVIATGGGAIMHHDAWQDLRKDGWVVWLQAEPGTIRKRLRQDELSESQRPSLTGSSLSGEVEEVLASRHPYYEKGSDLTVDTTNMSPAGIILNIVKLLTDDEIQ